MRNIRQHGVRASPGVFASLCRGQSPAVMIEEQLNKLEVRGGG